MGMYTGLNLDVQLRQDTPQDVLAMLDWMILCEPEKLENKPELPAHALFSTERWNYMLRCTSAYLEPDYMPESKREGLHLIAKFNLKNYKSEIEKFLDWISPYVEKLNSGLYRYEEHVGDSPVLMVDGKLAVDTNHPNHHIEF